MILQLAFRKLIRFELSRFNQALCLMSLKTIKLIKVKKKIVKYQNYLQYADINSYNIDFIVPGPQAPKFSFPGNFNDVKPSLGREDTNLKI